jgi:GH24 family phage-related lysozyme (muramidase)
VNTSPSGIAFIASNEGYAPIPQDDNGHLMWGHGHDQQPGEIPPTSISLPGADTLLRTDLATRFDPHLAALLPSTATQNQIDACSDFMYNEGPVALATMLHHGWDQVPVQMLAWCYEHREGVVVKSAGLLERREKEVALFTS